MFSERTAECPAFLSEFYALDKTPTQAVVALPLPLWLAERGMSKFQNVKMSSSDDDDDWEQQQVRRPSLPSSSSSTCVCVCVFCVFCELMETSVTNEDVVCAWR